jgi:GNAT superfamily N-acetyltransferase
VARSAGGATRVGSRLFPLEVKEVDPTTAPLITAAMGSEGDLVAARLARGCRCFGAWLGGELVGYGWLSTRPEWIGEIELEIAPGAREAYVWNCVTLGPHRRKGVFGGLVTSLVAQAREEGLARLWIGSAGNLADHAIERAGFVPVVRFDTTSRFGFLWLTMMPVADVDPGLLAAGPDVMPIKPGSTLRRSKLRRH